MMKRSLMVPGSLSSALQTTYFTGSACLRTRSHFMLVGNPAPPMPFSSAALSCARTSSHASDAVFFILAIWVGLAGHARLLGMRFVNLFAADGAAGDLFGVSGGDISED